MKVLFLNDISPPRLSRIRFDNGPLYDLKGFPPFIRS